jgi:hypothetical protein
VKKMNRRNFYDKNNTMICLEMTTAGAPTSNLVKGGTCLIAHSFYRLHHLISFQLDDLPSFSFSTSVRGRASLFRLLHEHRCGPSSANKSIATAPIHQSSPLQSYYNPPAQGQCLQLPPSELHALHCGWVSSRWQPHSC